VAVRTPLDGTRPAVSLGGAGALALGALLGLGLCRTRLRRPGGRSSPAD
jgi:hypothetical protein